MTQYSLFGAEAAAPALAEGPLNVTTYGGAFGRTVEEAYVKPFAQETGIQATVLDASDPPARLKAEVEAGNITSDVYEVEQSDVIRLCDEGLVEPIDPAAAVVMRRPEPEAARAGPRPAPPE